MEGYYAMANKNSEMEELIANTGVAIPLTASIAKTIMDSGASLLEARIALSLVGGVIELLPLRLVADGVSSPELARPTA